MIKIFLFVLLLAICSRPTSTCKKSCPEDPLKTCEEKSSHSFLDTAIDMISKAKCYIPSCKKNTQIALRKAADCLDLLEMGRNTSGVYEIWPMNKLMEGKPAYVYCDMCTDGGGWTVIQRRGDYNTPKDYFYRNWENYKEGFGNIEKDFWLGNDKIFALTNQKAYSVRFDLRDMLQETRYAVYDKFWIDDEERMYNLHISLYSGDAGDAMAYHNNKNFTTFDKGKWTACSRWDKGGWWYDWCHRANLNGLYYKAGKFNSTNNDGVSWKPWKGDRESLEWAEIKIRPKDFRPDSSK